MAYSNIAHVKQEAGFSRNSKIDETSVARFRDAADNHIDSILSKRYSLPLSETPALIEQISRKLAAGHLLLEEYGTEAEGTDKDGQKKVSWAQTMLDGIEDGTIPLIGSDGTELANSSNSNNMSGFPDSNAGTDKTAQAYKDDPPIFEVGAKF